jgi:hypothetical protein
MFIWGFAREYLVAASAYPRTGAVRDVSRFKPKGKPEGKNTNNRKE